MGRNSKPRKAYRPKPRHLNAVQRAMEGSALLPRHNVAELVQAMDQALAEFRKGQRCSHHWAVMADAINMASQLAKRGICSDHTSVARINAAHDALADVQRQSQATGCWTLRAAQTEAIDMGLFIHGAQLAHCCFTEYEAAVAAVTNITQQALAGNVGPGTVVLQGQIGRHPASSLHPAQP